MSSFSNYGSASVDVFAPGSGITVIYNPLSPEFGGYAVVDGTSFSSPLVAGICAMVWSRNPTWNYLQVKNAVMQGAQQISSLKGKAINGGIVDFFNAVRSGALTVDAWPKADLPPGSLTVPTPSYLYQGPPKSDAPTTTDAPKTDAPKTKTGGAGRGADIWAGAASMAFLLFCQFAL